MDSPVSLEDRIWFLRVCHHVPFALYHGVLLRGYSGGTMMLALHPIYPRLRMSVDITLFFSYTIMVTKAHLYRLKLI